MSKSSIWPIDKTQLRAITPGKSGPGSDGNEGVPRIPRSSIITGASPLDFLVLYPGHSLSCVCACVCVCVWGGFCPSAAMQLVYYIYSSSQMGYKVVEDYQTI